MKWTSLFSIVLLISSAVGFADDGKNAQSGEVSFEDTKNIDPRATYDTTQDQTIEYFKKAAASIPTLSQSPSPLADLSDNMINYLNGVYLYCTINSGTCAIPLQAILEVDIINSKIKGVSECPNMKRFWKLWLANDMESRQQYLVKTGFISATSDFSRNVRPSFVRCEATITSETTSQGSAADYFKGRYGPGQPSPQTESFSRLVSLLEAVKQKVPNVFIATGATSEKKSEDKDKEKGKDTITSGKPNSTAAKPIQKKTK